MVADGRGRGPEEKGLHQVLTLESSDQPWQATPERDQQTRTTSPETHPIR
jgi:hypothetical protein